MKVLMVCTGNICRSPTAEGVFRTLAQKEVPDPYYGGPEEFERVLDMVEAASRGLIDHARAYLRVSI